MSSRIPIHSVDDTFNSLLRHIFITGHEKEDRTGTGTLSVFGTQSRYDLRGGKIPLITSRKIHHRSFIHETLWFLSGSTDIEYLKANNVSIWDSWVKEGTERYSTLTTDEIKSAISKAFKPPVVLEIGSDSAEEEKVDIIQDLEQVTLRVFLTRPIVDELWRAAYRAVLGEEPVGLSGGSIGTGAYGSQWRAWEDTRVIPATESESYFKRGFDYIGEVAHTDMTVVQRKIDQIANVIDQLKNNPDSRRILVVAYNPAKVEDCVLPPCHSVFQLWTRLLTKDERIAQVKELPDLYAKLIYELALKRNSGSKDEPHTDYTITELLNNESNVMATLDELEVPKRALSCHLFQRSSDLPVGGAFNIAQYGLLTHMIAQVTNMVAEELVWSASDQHIYLDQISAVKEQLRRDIYQDTARVELNPEIRDIDDFTFEDIKIVDYVHGPVLKYPVAV